MTKKELELLRGKVPARTLDEIKSLGKLITKKSVIDKSTYQVYQIKLKSGPIMRIEEWDLDGNFDSCERTLGCSALYPEAGNLSDIVSFFS
jgi:hypothetical protein